MVSLFQGSERHTGRIFQPVVAKALVKRYPMGQMAGATPRLQDIILKTILKISFGQYSVLCSRFKSSKYCSIPAG